MEDILLCVSKFGFGDCLEGGSIWRVGHISHSPRKVELQRSRALGVRPNQKQGEDRQESRPLEEKECCQGLGTVLT